MFEPPRFPQALNGHGYTPAEGDADKLARVIFAEGAGTPNDYRALAWSVVNRVGRADKGSTLDQVINQKNAYESLHKGKLWDAYLHPEALAPADQSSRERALQAATDVLRGAVPDPTDGATMFIPDWVYHGTPTQQGDYRRMFAEDRLDPSPYNSRTISPKNYFFIEKPPSKQRR